MQVAEHSCTNQKNWIKSCDDGETWEMEVEVNGEMSTYYSIFIFVEIKFCPYCGEFLSNG